MRIFFSAVVLFTAFWLMAGSAALAAARQALEEHRGTGPATSRPQAKADAEENTPDTLTLTNASRDDILNLRWQKGNAVFFVRLDLPPAAQDAVENPGTTQDLRVDTGLHFYFYKAIPLGKLKGLTFCNEHSPCLILQHRDGTTQHLAGRAQSLLPQSTAQRPVCALSSFRPGMTMREVCSFLHPDPPRDANDAVLTELGFAGLVWAARLTPRQNRPDGRVSGEDELGHLELRRELVPEDLNRLLKTLYAQGYAPWQAEFPGLDMDFTEMAALSLDKQKAMLQQTIDFFLHAGRDEACIMLAPQQMLPALADADAPQGDVQLFTITLRKASHVLVVDVASFDKK